MEFRRLFIVVAGMVVAGASAFAQGFAGGAYRPGAGITNPTELKFGQPMYTQAARDARIEGMVVVEAVVDAAGKVANTRVIQSLDTKYGLDAQALDAVKHWTFNPATKDGKPVPIIVQLEVMFRLSTNPTAPTADAFRRAIVAKPPQDPIKLPDDDFAKGAFAEDTPGLVKPREKRFVEPKYTSAAMRAKIQGTVVIEAIVGVDGTVTKARVFESLDNVHGLDDEALSAVKKWTFEPGTLSGKAVPVYARFEVMFRLH